ncbi:NAD(P)-binding domain-containing protein [Neobacillus niacini]|uniref:NAD(P)-binding domain-containing protein n=1 Tax=Neobacillus niacini TaxID=86668 RepID=UPI002FFD5EE5
MLDLAIVGAGPYGISLAAHAAKAGLRYRVFGYPMDFWQFKMPPNMFIRTMLEYTNLSDPEERCTLKEFQKEKGLRLSYPIPRSVFVEYGKWFIEKLNLSIEKVYISHVRKEHGFFVLETENRNTVEAKNVIIAVGLTNSRYIPRDLAHVPKEYLSHTGDFTVFEQFRNQHVAVIGGGQSAWEASALLHQAHARVELIYRRPRRLDPEQNLNAKQKEIADEFFYYPQEKKMEVRKQFEKPTVSDFLVPLVEGNVTQRPNTFIVNTTLTKVNKVQVLLNDDTTLLVDHIIAATGYRFNPHNLSFLVSIIDGIKCTEGLDPIVDESFQSTLPHLYFAGPATAFCYGPAFRFISGVKKTSQVIINSISADTRK